MGYDDDDDDDDDDGDDDGIDPSNPQQHVSLINVYTMWDAPSQAFVTVLT